jgi:hypothetical protein
MLEEAGDTPVEPRRLGEAPQVLVDDREVVRRGRRARIAWAEVLLCPRERAPEDRRGLVEAAAQSQRRAELEERQGAEPRRLGPEARATEGADSAASGPLGVARAAGVAPDPGEDDERRGERGMPRPDGAPEPGHRADRRDLGAAQPTRRVERHRSFVISQPCHDLHGHLDSSRLAMARSVWSLKRRKESQTMSKVPQPKKSLKVVIKEPAARLASNHNTPRKSLKVVIKAPAARLASNHNTRLL